MNGLGHPPVSEYPFTTPTADKDLLSWESYISGGTEKVMSITNNRLIQIKIRNPESSLANCILLRSLLHSRT